MANGTWRSTGGGGADPEDIWELVDGYPVTLGAAATQIDFSSLDVDTYDYDIDGNGLAASGFNGTLKINGSATGLQYIYQNLTTAAAGSGGGTELFGSVAGDYLQLQVQIRGCGSGFSGANRAWGSFLSRRDAGSLGAAQPGYWQWDVHNTNATSFSMVSSVASGWDAGSIFWLRRRKRSA